MKITLCKGHFAGPVSGADEALITYAVGLHEAGDDVRVVLLYKYSDQDEYYTRLKRAGVPVSCVITHSLAFSMLRRLRDLAASLFFFLFFVPQSLRSKVWRIGISLVARFHYRKCRTFFDSLRPDLMHVLTPDKGAEMMIRAGHELGIPVIYHELGTPQYMPMLDEYYKQLEKVLPLCTEVAALSPRLGTQWAERFRFLKFVSVIPLMVHDCDEREMVVKETATRDTVFGYAARIEEGKGPLVLISALAKLKSDLPRAVVRMAGIGPQLAEVKARVRKLQVSDVLEFAGHYSEPMGRTAFMRSLDVFILPSVAEGTPNSIIEAMAHGLPVIASEVGGIPDLLSPETGILVPPADEKALAQAMRRLASDPELRKRMGRAARERYVRLFTAEAVLPVLRSTYLRVASTKSSCQASTHAQRVAHPWEIAPEF